MDGAPIDKFYEIVEFGLEHVRRFNTEAVTLIIRFRNLDNFPVTRIEEIFDQILHRQLQNVQPTDYVGVELNHMSLCSRVLVLFTHASEMSGDKVLSAMERIQQSKESFKFNESMVMKLVIVEMPQGGKGNNEASNTRIVNWDEWYKKHCGHGGCFLQVY